MQAYQYAFNRFQVRCVEYGTRNNHAINGATRREGKSKITQRITFVVINNGIGEVNSISGIGFEGVEQIYRDLLPCRFNFRLLHLRRRNNDFFVSLFELDEFIEFNQYFCSFIV
ncbi:hypothetical protein SDC9_141834 [bioreactor metagenome]|uniref:Uncharacterized protein n=1 Tax=bioreactor metagenome TaxID=1076179 RepID=A0A645DZD6_9ZZZZ